MYVTLCIDLKPASWHLWSEALIRFCGFLLAQRTSSGEADFKGSLKDPVSHILQFRDGRGSWHQENIQCRHCRWGFFIVKIRGTVKNVMQINPSDLYGTHIFVKLLCIKPTLQETREATSQGTNEPMTKPRSKLAVAFIT